MFLVFNANPFTIAFYFYVQTTTSYTQIMLAF